MIDVIYPVRRDERNHELRYSLRSLRNLPDVGRVWLIGFKPSWVEGVEHIPGNRYHNKWLNVPDNLRLACESIEADRYLVMNDDFYVTEPVAELPSYHRGTLREHIDTTRGAWHRSLVQTRQILTGLGIEQPLSYEVHFPIVMERAKLTEALGHVAQHNIPAQWRTIYGNLWQVPSVQAPDCKLRTMSEVFKPSTFVSTDPGTFRRVQPWLSRLFPEPSPYERVAVVAA